MFHICHRHHNSKRAPSLLNEGEMLLDLGITTNITTFYVFSQDLRATCSKLFAISEGRADDASPRRLRSAISEHDLLQLS